MMNFFSWHSTRNFMSDNQQRVPLALIWMKTLFMRYSNYSWIFPTWHMLSAVSAANSFFAVHRWRDNCEVYRFPQEVLSQCIKSLLDPQADSIINEHVIHALPQCDTIENYICMLDTIRGAVYENVDQQCLKSCKAESYKTSSIENNMDAFNSVSYNLSNKI